MPPELLQYYPQHREVISIVISNFLIMPKNLIKQKRREMRSYFEKLH